MVEMNSRPKIQFDAQHTKPLASFMLIILCGSVYVMAAGPTGSSSDDWITNNCFNPAKCAATWGETVQLFVAGLKGTPNAFALVSTNISDLVKICFLSAFASADRYQVVINCYLLWVFGASMEQRIGFARIFMLVLLAVLLPWFVVGFEAATRDPASTYYSPFLMLSTLVGASFVFPPEKKINTEWFKSSRGDIFAKQEELDLMSRYQFKPMMFLSLFIVLEAGIYFYNLGFGKVLEAHHPGLKTFALLACAAAVMLGYLTVSLIVWSATGSLKDGPMRLITVKMYNDILKLDVGHETAIKGTAHALGLPPERVKEWVMKQKGKMRVS
ncbi:MAG: hypothetical protein KGS72_05285 [Cyanobacteria bacterium REEB67]|nr:hypothetical protein [Cyanobacteria bacterium REEB67]